MQRQNSSAFQLYIKKIFIYGVTTLNLCIFMFSSDTFRNDALFSLSARLILVISIISFFPIYIRKKAQIRLFRSMILLIVMLLLAFVSYGINPAGSLLDFIIKIGGYLSIPIYTIVIPECSYDENEAKYIKIFSVLYAVFFIYAGLFKPTYRTFTGALMLGYTNSNHTGAYMMLVFILLLVTYRNAKSKAVTASLVIIEVLLLYLMVLTQCRTAVLICLVCLVYMYVPKFKSCSRIFTIACFLFPAVFLVGYVSIYYRGWLQDVTFLGIPIFSGRQYVFQNELRALTLFGDYGDSLFGGLNYVLSIVNTLGIAGIISYWVFMSRFLYSDFLDICDDNRKKNVRFFISVLLLHGCTESSLFTGGTIYAGMFACILISGISNRLEERKEC